MFGHGFLTGMRSGVLQTRIESDGSSFERLEAHRAGNIGDARKPLGAEKREPTHCVHRLRTVEQSKALLRL